MNGRAGGPRDGHALEKQPTPEMLESPGPREARMQVLPLHRGLLAQLFVTQLLLSLKKPQNAF